MPLFNQYKINENCTWGIWQLTENEEDLLRLLGEKIETEELLRITNKQRRVQWLGARALVSTLLPEKKFYICKDSHGKPYIEGRDGHISFSHAGEYAVAIFHKKKSVGIDIEKVSLKIQRVISRVCTEEELNQVENSLENLTLLWCAKEALYKCYGKKKLDFKKGIKVRIHSQEQNDNNEQMMTGKIIKEENSVEVNLHQISFDNYKIVYCF
jgi:phosphopantetheinyl transferase